MDYIFFVGDPQPFVDWMLFSLCYSPKNKGSETQKTAMNQRTQRSNIIHPRWNGFWDATKDFGIFSRTQPETLEGIRGRKQASIIGHCLYRLRNLLVGLYICFFFFEIVRRPWLTEVQESRPRIECS